MAKPVVFIPGYPGTHLIDRQTGKKVFLNIIGLINPAAKKRILKQLEAPDDLQAPDPLVAGEPIRKLAKFVFFDLAKQADSLYHLLGKIGVDPVKFGWDWRRPVYDIDMQQRLETAVVDERQRTGARVTVIAHSTGGLVLRHLLESHRNNPAFLDKIEQVIAFGVPWAGTLKSFLFLTRQKAFGPFLSNKETQRVVSLTWAAYDLLPPDPAKTTLMDAAGRPLRLVLDGNARQVSPLLKRGWFDSGLKSRMIPRADGADTTLGRRTSALRLGGHRLPVVNVVGWGEETVIRAVITGPANQQSVAFIEEEGDDLQGGGDGTVPRVSASWLRSADVKTFHVPVGVDHGAKMSPHSILWRNPGGRNLLRHLLAGNPLEPFVYGAVDDEDSVRTSVANVRIRLVALDGAGVPLANAAVRATDLKSGPTPFDAFDPAGEGRHLIRIPRRQIREVGNQYRRFTLEYTWTEQGQAKSLRQSYFVAK